MARYARALLEPVLGARAPLSDRIGQLVVLLLPRGHCRVEVVAKELGVDRRTVATICNALHRVAAERNRAPTMRADLCNSRAPLLDSEVRHSCEVSQIVCHQRRLLRDRVARDEQIHVSDRGAQTLQLCTNTSVVKSC
jgi:hypothetical protein